MAFRLYRVRLRVLSFTNGVAQAATNPPWLDAALGPLGLLVFLLVGVVWGGIKQWWVFGWQYREAVRDRDDWRHLALQGTSAADKAAEVAKSMLPGTLEEMARKVDEARRRGDIR